MVSTAAFQNVLIIHLFGPPAETMSYTGIKPQAYSQGQLDLKLYLNKKLYLKPNPQVSQQYLPGKRLSEF